VHEDPSDGGPLVCVEGAPEVVLDMCDSELDERGDAGMIDTDALRRPMDEMAASGMHVLAMAVGRARMLLSGS